MAVILIQTLRFKFTAHPDSVYIFEKVGLEAYGRFIIGVLKLIAGILILTPISVWIGATLSLSLIGGAIIMHITKIGMVVNNDSGVLFITAVLTFILSGIILYVYRLDFLNLIKRKY